MSLNSNKQITLNPNNISATRVSDGAAYNINEPSNIVDGNFSSGGEIGGGSGVSRASESEVVYITYTFDEPVGPITKIIYKWGSAFARTYKMRASLDGTDFTLGGESGTYNSFGLHGLTNQTSTDSTTVPITSTVVGSIITPTTIDNYQKFKAIRFEITLTDDTVIDLDELQIFIPDNTFFEKKDYNVEFDDALLDLAGWKNPRYEGSKLTGVRINQFNQGDISYGLNPVIERKTACIFLGKDIDEGIANDQDIPLAEIINHSYLTINKILFIDLDSDEVEIVSRENMSSTAFNRIITENFPEGSTTIVKSLEDQADKLKTQHTVKFNRGQLMKVYSYVANEDGYEDGVFGGHEVWEYKGTNQPVVSGSGLFGYGQSAIASQSLFNTGSLLFTTLLPSELNFYEGNYSTTTMGSTLTNATASISGSNTSGVSTWDNEDENSDIPSKFGDEVV